MARRKFVRPSAATILDGFDDEQFTPAAADLTATLRANAKTVVPAKIVENLVKYLSDADRDTFRVQELQRAVGLSDVASTLVHPSTIRSLGRAGLMAYVDGVGKVRKIQVAEPRPAAPKVDLGEVDPDFYLEPSWLPAFRRFMERDRTVLLIGPAGAGKTYAAEKEFQRREQEFVVVSMNPSMDSDDIEGKMDLRDGNTIFTPSPIVQASENGWGLILDEADAAPAEACFSLYRLIDHREMRILRRADAPAVDRHKDLRIVGTQNTEGRGDARGLFHGRSFQDEAFLDRWDAVIRVDYPNRSAEALILVKRTGIPKLHAENIAEAAHRLRQAQREGRLMFSASLRRTQAVADNLVHGDTIEAAWHYGAVNRATPEEQESIREVLTRIYGSTFSKPIK